MSNKKPSKYQLTDIQGLIEQENYSKALICLKDVKIKQEEAGFAKQLKAKINVFTALEKMSEYEIDKAISILENNSEIQPKQGFPLVIDETNICLGICNLYLGNFEKAKKHLEFTKQKQEYNYFYFYFLIACIYNNDFKDIDLKKILADNNHITSTFPDDHKIYLQAFFGFITENEKTFLKKLKSIKTESRIPERNIGCLIKIVEKKPYISDIIGLKPLYKILSEKNLSITESNFLKKFKEFNTHIETSEKTKDMKVAYEVLHNLNKFGEPVDLIRFEEILQIAELKPHFNKIIYNQLAALQIIKNESHFSKILLKYSKNFFEIPESIKVYLKYCNSSNLPTNIVFNHVEYYLNIHHKNLSPYAIDLILAKVVLKTNPTFNNQKVETYYNAFSKFERYKKDLIALHTLKLVDNLVVPSKKISEENIKILEHENFEDISQELILIISEVNEMLSNPFSIFDSYDGDEKLFQYKLLTLLSFEINLNKKSKSILRFYQMATKYLNNSYKKIVTKETEKKFLQNFYKAIIFYKEFNENSTYLKDYNSILYKDNVGEIIKYIKKRDENKLIEFLLKEFENKDLTSINHFIELSYFDDLWNEEELYLFRCYFITIFKKFGNEINETTQKIFDLFRHKNVENKKSIFTDLLNSSFSNKYLIPKHYQVIINIFILSKDLLFTKTFNAREINLIFNFLKLTISYTLNENSKHEKEIIDYLSEILSENINKFATVKTKMQQYNQFLKKYFNKSIENINIDVKKTTMKKNSTKTLF